MVVIAGNFGAESVATFSGMRNHWRETRVKGNRIPQYLWDAMRILTKQYTCSQIASELKINPHRLQTKMEHQQQQVSPLSKTSFIEVPLFPSSYPHSSFPGQKPVSPSAGAIIECTCPDGATLKASGLTREDLCSLIKNFLGQIKS